MINKFLTILLLGLSSTAFGQHTLEECQRLARTNYPLAKQRGLIEQSLDYTLSNANKGYVPQASLSLRATLQSDVTGVPLPNVKSLPKDQYQAVLEVRQTVWEGGVIYASKNVARGQAEIAEHQLDMDLYAIRDRVNSIYFSILLFDEQLVLNQLYADELQRNFNLVNAYVSSGIATSTDLDAVIVEQLTNHQNRSSLIYSRLAFMEMLSALVGEPVDSLSRPAMQPLALYRNMRPELALFDAQIAQADLQHRAIVAKNLPKIGLFVQGAYGNPGLNMLNSGFTPYAIGGISLSWNFGGYYTQHGDFAKLKLQQQNVETLRQTFLLNTRLSATQEQGRFRKLQSQLTDDERIIKLRGEIKKASQAKVAAGTMTVTDMMRDVTAENNARQTKILHEIDLLFSMYTLKYLTNQ